jgi:hypothetical protein
MPTEKGNKKNGSDDQIGQSSDNDQSFLSPISFYSPASQDVSLPEHPTGTQPPLPISSSHDHGRNDSLSKWDLSPDEFGQPLTKDMLRKKDRIDQVADKLLQDQLQKRQRGISLDMSYLEKRHSDDELTYLKDAMHKKGENTSDKQTSLNLSSRPSSQRSSRRSSLFQTDESGILKQFSKHLRSDSNQSVTSEKSRYSKAALEDIPDDDPLWLQVPTWSSSKTGLRAWLYRIASRCMTSRGCETGGVFLDLTTDEIIQVAHNVRALHDFRNRTILEQALQQKKISLKHENPLFGKKRYAPSILSMGTTVSHWDDIEQDHRQRVGADSDFHLSYEDQSNISPDSAMPNSESSRALSVTGTPPKSPSGSSQSSNVDRTSDTPLYNKDANTANSRGSLSTTGVAEIDTTGIPKLLQLGISDQEESEAPQPFLRFENSSLHFISRTNKFRLFLWRTLGKWYA